jgi:hypothetical protein
VHRVEIDRDDSTGLGSIVITFRSQLEARPCWGSRPMFPPRPGRVAGPARSPSFVSRGTPPREIAFRSGHSGRPFSRSGPFLLRFATHSSSSFVAAHHGERHPVELVVQRREVPWRVSAWRQRQRWRASPRVRERLFGHDWTLAVERRRKVPSARTSIQILLLDHQSPRSEQKNTEKKPNVQPKCAPVLSRQQRSSSSLFPVWESKTVKNERDRCVFLEIDRSAMASSRSPGDYIR